MPRRRVLSPLVPRERLGQTLLGIIRRIGAHEERPAFEAVRSQRWFPTRVRLLRNNHVPARYVDDVDIGRIDPAAALNV